MNGDLFFNQKVQLCIRKLANKHISKNKELEPIWLLQHI